MTTNNLKSIVRFIVSDSLSELGLILQCADKEKNPVQE